MGPVVGDMKDSISPADHCARDRKRALLARFLRDPSGSTAIEFVLLALPFSLLVFAIIESCIAFAGQQVLTNAVDDVARQFRTGQLRIESSTTPEAAKKLVEKMICDRFEVFVAKGCEGLQIDLQTYASYEEAAKVRIPFIYDAKGNRSLKKTDFKATPGPSLSKNMLRAFYEWPVITNYMLSNLQGGKILMFAASVWQNEPFNN